MQPGKKTRAPLQSRESDQGHVPAYLRLTLGFYPNLNSIGAPFKLRTINASGFLRLAASVMGRNVLVFGIDALSQYLAIGHVAIAQRLEQVGAYE